MREIDPEYSYRYDIDFIRRSYEGLEEAFEQGDFILVSQFAEKNSELKGMAYILAGLPEKGIQILDLQLKLSERAKVILAFGLWYVDRTRSALAILKGVERQGRDGKMANKLEALIQSENIIVFQTILSPPSSDDPPTGDPLYKAERSYGQFVVRNVATQAAKNYYDISVEDDFEAFISGLPDEEKPHLLLATVTHWFFPRNFHKVDIPKVLWNHDEDMFLHRIFDHYRQMDVNIVPTSQQQFELSWGCGTFSPSNLLAEPFSTPYQHPRAGAKEKDIDVLFTGAICNKFLAEKARFLFNISRLSSDYNLLFHDGRLEEKLYRDAMSRTKFLPIVSRILGNPSPRWREILESDGFLLYPENTLFGDVSKGSFSYGLKDPAGDIEKHLKSYVVKTPGGEYDHDSARNDISDQFSLHICSREKLRERFLRLSAFYIILRDNLDWQRKRRSDPRPAAKRRAVWLTPNVDLHYFGRENIFGKINADLPRISEVQRDWDVADFNNAALTNFRLGFSLLFTWKANDKNKPESIFQDSETIIKKAFAILDQGIDEFPNSLLLEFNKVQWRFLSEYICGADLQEFSFQEQFHSLLMRFDELEFEPLGSDIGTIDNCYEDRVFPYYEYGQSIIKYAVSFGSSDEELVKQGNQLRTMIHSAIHGYLGWLSYIEGKTDGAIQHIEDALALFSNNLPLQNLKFDVLLNISSKTPQQQEEFIESFYSYSNLYPVALLEHLHMVLPELRKLNHEEEIRKLLSDWYYFGNCFDEETLKKVISHYDLVSMGRFKKYFPDELLNKIHISRNDHRILKPFEEMLWAAIGKGKYAPRIKIKRKRWYHKALYNLLKNRFARNPQIQHLYRKYMPLKLRFFIRFKLLPKVQSFLH